MRVTDPERREVTALESIADFVGKDVLEIGCGDGRLTWRYADAAASVLAIDPIAADVAKARKALPRRLRSRVRFRVADVTTEPLPDSTFDLAILSYSL